MSPTQLQLIRMEIALWTLLAVAALSSSAVIIAMALAGAVAVRVQIYIIERGSKP